MGLTKEQRAAKFAAKPQGPGLVSRGNKKLSIEEQRKIFNELASQSNATKLMHLRSLRESLMSTPKTEANREFEQRVYEASVRECVEQNALESVPHLLGHLCHISPQMEAWRKLYCIVLSNTRQFNEALAYCACKNDEQYLMSLMLVDSPLYNTLISREQEPMARKLMSQAEHTFAGERARLKVAYR